MVSHSARSGMRTLFSQAESTSCKQGNWTQISGSAAIVVGGACGLGEAAVRRLNAAGGKVVIADLADDKGKELESGRCLHGATATSRRRARCDDQHRIDHNL